MSNVTVTTDTSADTLPTFDPTAKNIAIITILTIIVLVTILGNLIVLLAFFLEPKLRNETFNYYIFNLAITDFLVAITAMTFYTIDTVLGYWPFGPAMCAFWIYFDYAMTFGSVFTLTAISVDRFWSVTWPIHYRIHSTVRKTSIMIAIVWACVFVIWTPPFIGDRLKHNDELYSCIWEPSENLEFIIVVDIIGHYLPCFLMVISYVKVFTVMKARAKVGHISNVSRAANSYNSQHSKPEMTPVQSTTKINEPSRSLSKEQISDTTGLSGHHEISTVDRTMKPLTQQLSTPRISKLKEDDPKRESNKQKRADENRYNKTERKIFITLSYVIISYTICWFPFYVTWDIYAFHPDIVPPLVYTVMFWMTYINSTLNPFIYAYTNKVFRNTFLKILRCQFK